MKTKKILKIITDVFMTAALLLLMAYSLIGEAAHEWLGVIIFLLFVLHHILNIKWYRNLFRVNYPPIRVFGTARAPLYDMLHDQRYSAVPLCFSARSPHSFTSVCQNRC